MYSDDDITKTTDRLRTFAHRPGVTDARAMALNETADMLEQQQVEINRLTARNALLDTANGGDRELLLKILGHVETIDERTFRLVMRLPT